MVSEPLHDGHGRRISDLRVSVTDRCNFRCQYCMPAEGLAWLERSELLSFEEIERLVTLFASLGVYSVNGSYVDLVILYVVGVAGFAMRRFGWPVAPAIIGVILGPLAEQQLRRALAISQGDYGTLVDSPRAVVLFGIAFVVLLAPLVARIARKDRQLVRESEPV